MKRKLGRRMLSAALTLGIFLSQLPTAAFAATVTPEPGDTELNVEYFTSTFFKWDEDVANYYTREADDGDGKGFYFTDTKGYRASADADWENADTSKWPAFSRWIQPSSARLAQNYHIYSGLAATDLGSSNAPFSDAVNAANLFATDDSNTAYTDVYSNVQVPYVYDATTGYYTLSSDDNAVYFENGEGASNATMKIADRPAAYKWTYSQPVTGFTPFMDVSEGTPITNAVKSGLTPSETTGTTSAYQVADAWDENLYGFGMVTSVNFQMTDNGLDANGNPIQFQFSGDDDVWVYIDGKLALDIGGTHDAIVGTIDFSTGDVTLSTPKTTSYPGIGDKALDPDLSDAGKVSGDLAQGNVYEKLGTTLTGFASEGQHTMTIYYMDRGQGRTNCLIKFNLPQRDSVSVSKTINSNYVDENGNELETAIPNDVMTALNNGDYTFTLYNNGVAVPNKNYTLYLANGQTSTASTDSNGKFTLKGGQTATFRNISLDEPDTSYYVKEDNPGTRWSTPSWTAQANVGNVNKSGTGYTSETVTVTGSSTSTDTINFAFTNSYIYKSGLAVDAVDDTIVVDYGLPVKVGVTGNDSVTNNGAATTGYTISLENADENGVVTGSFGTAKLVDGQIEYTMTSPMTDIEKFTYTLSITDEINNTVISDTATLTIVPATSIYYEEDFATTGSDHKTTGMVTWKTNSGSVGQTGTSTDSYQETGFVGDATDSTYGADTYYLSNLGDSAGTSYKADTTSGAVQFSYSFTGTGTTIYGRVSEKTGYIQVEVTPQGSNEAADTKYINTRNLLTPVSEGATDTFLDGTLYNIPIYQNTELQYGSYDVTVYVYKDGVHTSGAPEFYLDGIRVFEPMNPSSANASVAEAAYAADGEANVAVVNIHEKVAADLEVGDASDIFTLTDVDGEILDYETYGSIGPNHEFYLKENYSGEFALMNWDSQSYKLYLGMKAPNGTATKVTIGSETFTIDNSSDCYYDISNCVKVNEEGIGIVSLTGVSDLVALTNVKVTGVDRFVLIEGGDITADSETENTLYLVSPTYLEGLNGEEETETQVFEPESISVSCNYAKRTKRCTVNVVTSKDVAYVTINGETFTGKNVSGKLRFSQTYKKVTAGTTYSIVCYNADGVASQTYTVTAK